MLDEDAGLLIITSQSRWRDANPDIIEFSQVLGCDMDIDEQRTEIYRETKDGERESYNPPRYDLDYDFNLTIHVNTPYFTEINLRVNDSTIDQRGSIEYREAKRQATEVRDALVQLRQETRDSVVAAKAPKTAVTCPFCGATTIPDASGRCEYCGGAIGALALLFGMPEFPAQDYFTAVAGGIMSGLTATGVNQIGKQLAKNDTAEK